MVDRQRIEELGRELLVALGENPERPGIQDTPRRWANWWAEFMDYQPGKTNTAFEAITSDQMVTISGMRVYSLCEHHLLPFYADIHIGYIADGHVLGLSKFARIAHQFAHRLQIQEQLTNQIADEVVKLTGSEDVAVLAEGEHLCMTMRGIKTPAIMRSSIMRGRFLKQAETRAEFLRMIGR